MSQETNLPVDEQWLEGFCKAAEEAGMDTEAATELLRQYAHQNEMETNEKYAEAYTEGLQKEAGIGAALGGFFGGLAKPGVLSNLAAKYPRLAGVGGLGLGAAGMSALGGIGDRMRMIGMSPEQKGRYQHIQNMQNMFRSGASPMEIDLYAGQMGRSGMKNLQSQLNAYKGLYGGAGGDKKDYYRRWYLS